MAPALAGDVWMHAETRDEGNDVVLDVPANGMAADAERTRALTGINHAKK